MAGILRDPKRELFCQLIVSGCQKQEAYQKAGFKGNGKQQSSTLLRKPDIQKRIDGLMGNLASKAEISRKQILERIYEDWENCRRLGQMSSALKAAELMGRELHHMFVERREIGGPGDFDAKSEDELKQIVRDGLEQLGWDNPLQPPKTIN
jgi:hypothetical protein